MISKALAIALALALAGCAWLWYLMDSAQDELTKVRADMVQTALKYSENAREAEAKETKRRLEIANEKDNAFRRINDDLLAELDRLRVRADRVPSTDGAPRPACAGATGAELSGGDAAFLARYAARAESIRQALAACQQRERTTEVTTE